MSHHSHSHGHHNHHLLWKAYWDDDLDRFRRLLGGPGSHGGQTLSSRGGAGSLMTASDVNSRDHAGLTVLLRVASSSRPSALGFVRALLEHPAVDVYVQDVENGWNALHRALYVGNVAVARALLQKERRDLRRGIVLPSSAGGVRGAGGGSGSATASLLNRRVGMLIRTKDHEGNSPFDLYNSTVAPRGVPGGLAVGRDDESRDGSESTASEEMPVPSLPGPGVRNRWRSARLQRTRAADTSAERRVAGTGEELYTFGSNNNMTLGLGDQDDRQFPERVQLKRPDHLLHRFYDEYLEKTGAGEAKEHRRSVEELPIMIRHRPLVIRDVVLSKLHSAVITDDPVSNLYVCGVGRGGRLGLGDESTQFHFVPVQGALKDKSISAVALGQNHTLAVTSNGELWTWGSNTYSQLGYALPPPAKKDEESCTLTPRRVFGPLKNEAIIGVAASAIHSVAFSASALYCWGRNVGQLGLVDSDSGSLEVQPLPRKVASGVVASCSPPVLAVAAIERATAVLLGNRSVCVLTSYGYNVVRIPTSSPQSSVGTGLGGVHSIAAGGDATIAAVSGDGQLWTMALNPQRGAADANVHPGSGSTTNPSKKRNTVQQLQCIWKPRGRGFGDGVRSAGVGDDGSVIFCTDSGAVWRRVRRPTAKDAKRDADGKQKAYKFQRVPGLGQVVAVAASDGVFAAIRKDCTVLREHVGVGPETLRENISPLMPLADFEAACVAATDTSTTPRGPAEPASSSRGALDVERLTLEILKSENLAQDLTRHLTEWSYKNDERNVVVCVAGYREVRIPVHSWILSARSPVLRAALAEARESGSCELEDTFSIAASEDRAVIEFKNLDLISLANLVAYIYTDNVVPVWQFIRLRNSAVSSDRAYALRQIRVEVMRLATRLRMPALESAARLQSTPNPAMHGDFKDAINDPAFFGDADVIIDLDGDEVAAHSTILCRRCPWFDTLFNGRSGGAWLRARRDDADEPSDLVHIDMKHVDPESFKYVLRYLYADVGESLFDDVVVPTLDDFAELLMDVLGVANELMLDRLSQVCQHTLSRFATTRNVALLLNAVGGCSVTHLKDAGLEYICLQGEVMLENHLLDDLDDDLMAELDSTVQSNQLAVCPLVRRGDAERLLHERHPELAAEIAEERQRRVREMIFKATMKDDERKLSTSCRSLRVGSLDEATPSTPPTSELKRRTSTAGYNEPFSPALRPRDNGDDLLFEMEEDESSAVAVQPSRAADDSGDRRSGRLEQRTAQRGNDKKPESTSPQSTPAAGLRASQESVGTPSKTPTTGNPWKQPVLPTSRLDLRQIMTETSARSGITEGLASQKAKASAVKSATPVKMSQKERKKQQAQASSSLVPEAAGESSPSGNLKASPVETKASPWKMNAAMPRPSLKEALMGKGPAQSEMTIRRTASPDTRHSGQSRPLDPAIFKGPHTTAHVAASSRSGTASAVQKQAAAPGTSTPASSSANTTPQRPAPLVPHSKSYITPPPKNDTDPWFTAAGLGLADIIGQQRREQAAIRDAVAKRSLQDIQQEQEFQEWWDAESKRMQEEEARRQRERAAAERQERGGEGTRGGRGKRSGRRGKTDERRGDAAAGASASSSAAPAVSGSAAGGGRKAKGKDKERSVASFPVDTTTVDVAGTSTASSAATGRHEGGGTGSRKASGRGGPSSGRGRGG